MNKKLSRLVIAGLLALATANAAAREVRTPLLVPYRGYEHYPLPWPVDNDNCWNVNFWGAGLHRSTDKAFVDKNSTKTESLAGIFFGKETFTFADTMSPGTAINNPFLVFSQLTPRFDYQENTALFGFDVRKVFGCDCQSNFGLRGYIPFRAIKVTLDDCCDLEEGLDDVARVKQDDRLTNPSPFVPAAPDQTVVNAYAYRMDFVQALFQQQAGVSPFTPMIQQVLPVPPGDLLINNLDVTTANCFPVHVIARTDGSVPTGAYAAVITTDGACPNGVNFVAGVSTLPDSGALANNQRAVFGLATNYGPLLSNVAALRQLWLVPSAYNFVLGNPNPTVNPGELGFLTTAVNIGNRLKELVNTAFPTTDFLAQNGVTFATQRRYQVGDLRTELYVNRRWCNMFGEGAFGVSFPTGRDITSAQVGQLLIAQTPAGNNRHFELRFGGIWGWDPVDWFALKIDAYYNIALKRKEKIAAAFNGATVKNIGPVADANVSWQYFVGDADFTFMVPCICPELGFDVGYQFYYKTKDKVRFAQTTVTTFVGTSGMTDDNVAEIRTKQLAHKVKAEFFQTVWGWQLFAGFKHTFAGMNATRDSDWYLGMKVYF